MNSKLKSGETDELFDAISRIRTEEEFYNFFEDLCTVTELRAMAQRFTVARLLKSGRTYQEAAELTGASTATISRVSKCLAFGADGYNTIIDRLTEEKK